MPSNGLRRSWTRISLQSPPLVSSTSYAYKKPSSQAANSFDSFSNLVMAHWYRMPAWFNWTDANARSWLRKFYRPKMQILFRDWAKLLENDWVLPWRNSMTNCCCCCHSRPLHRSSHRSMLCPYCCCCRTLARHCCWSCPVGPPRPRASSRSWTHAPFRCSS